VSESDVRTRWLQLQNEDAARANENKQSQEVLLWLNARYRVLSEADRIVIDRLLSEQLSSGDETLRFDALALIREFRIVSALPALRQLADWLETEQWPGAPYEWAKVNQLIGVLVEPQRS
jgi:hypothetical protein